MSSLDESDQFGQLTSDFIDNKNNIYKTKGTFIHLIKNVNNVYQVNDILNNQLFDIPFNYFKKVEYTDLPNDVQQLIPPSSLNHKKKRSVTTLFSKFRTSKSSKSSTTTTTSTTSNTTSNNTSNNTTSNNNNYFNNNIKSNSSNTNTGSNTSLLDNTSSNNSSNNSNNYNYNNNNTIKLTTFDDNTTINSSGGGSVGDTSQDDEDDLDSDEDDVILQDRTNSFCKPSLLLNHHNNSGSSGRLNSISAPPSIDLPSLDLPPPSSSSSITTSNNSNNSTTSTIVSPKLSIHSSNQMKIELNLQQKEQLSTKLLKYYYKKQFKEYINKSPQVRQARLRKAALLEILTTEQTYFNSLLTCKQLFMDPLLNEAQTKKKPTLTLSDINDIFGELPNIMQASQLLMTDLKKEIDKWPTHPILIGNIFKSFAPFFRMYSKYINNFDSVAEKVEKLEKTSKSFSQFLIKTHEIPECCGLTFLSYLVCPVQRVPRIRMLLQEVIRRTDETHIDYQLLEQALLIVNQVAENLNESKRIAENDKIVFDLQEKMKGRFNNLLQAHRKFTTCFNSIHVESSKEIEKKRLYGFYNIYLFNDMLLIVPINSNNSNNNNNNSGGGGGSGGSNNSSSSSLSNLNDQSLSNSDSSSNLYNSEYEEERIRIARESFIFSLAFSKVKDKSLKDNDSSLQSNSSIESTSNSIQLLKLSSITNNSIGKFIFIMDTFIKTQQVKLTFSFNSQLQRDEMEAEISLNIEQLDSKNEKLFSKSKLKIENKRIEHVKLIKSNDMILSKNLLQKHVASEKLKEISDRLITCELELEVKLQYYKNYKEEYSKQYEKLEQFYQKESESLIEYEEQVQRIIQIDDTICKMLNHDIDAFRELFMDDPRNLLDQDYDMITSSPSLLSSSIGGGSMSGGAIGNSLSIGNTTAIYDIITGSNGPLTSQSSNNNLNNSSNSNNSSMNNMMNQQNTRSTISFDNSNDNSSSFDNSSSSSSLRKQTILPTRKMFNSAAALNLGILDGSSSSSRDSSLPLKQLKDSCNPYIQQAYKELRRKTFSSNNNSTNTNNTNNNNNLDNDEEVEEFNTLYRIRPNRKWYMMEPIKKLPNKYSIDRLLHGENTPQDIVPKIYPYPEEYNDPDLYYDKISHRDGFYNEEEEEMFSNNNYNNNNHLNDFDELNQDEFKSFNRNYSNYFDLPSNVDELRTIIIKLQFEKEDLRNDVSKLKQQLSSINNNTSNSNNNSTPSTPHSAATMMMMNNNEFNSPPPSSSSSLPPLTTSTTFSNNNNNITSPSTQSKQQQQPTEYIASDFIDEYIE